ncbi:MAG: glycosyltransferase family 2 protein, partial [Planctomycetaceae bacterium]|nr:glycosyltransferase family 2 protein [Planctomycetaceae bacterium]
MQSGVGEVVVADNGSTDGSQQLAVTLGARVIGVSQRGYGNALRGGIEASRGEYIIMGDADGSYDFSHANRILEKLEEGFDLVMGNRFLGGIEPGAMPWLHRYLGNPGSVLFFCRQRDRKWCPSVPFIDHWLQTGTFAPFESPRWSDPANSEVLGLWFAAPSTGDFLVPVSNVAITMVWALSVLELGRLLGVTGFLRHAAAMVCIALEVTVRQTCDAANDLMVAAFFSASLCYAIRFARSRSLPNLVLFAVSLGILAGTKFFAAGYALLSGVLFFRRNGKASRLGRRSACFPGQCR